MTSASMAALLTAGLIVTGAHAAASASVPQRITSASTESSSHASFHMPASERKNIAENPSWTAPQQPFRIYGNTWYVGPRGLGVYLLVASTGDVLIDGGVPGDAPLIEANIRTLGIPLHDVKWILVTHAHSDHAGGVTQLVHDTGAKVIAGAADVPLLERGGQGDPQYGDRFPFPPVQVARAVTGTEERLHLGTLNVTAYATPGHTEGNLSFTWTSCEDTRCLHVADVGSLSAPSFKLIGNPDLVSEFEHSFAVVAALPCDVPIAPHPGMVDFWARVAKRAQGDANALVDPSGCRAYADYARAHFEAELARQRASAK